MRSEAKVLNQFMTWPCSPNSHVNYHEQPSMPLSEFALGELEKLLIIIIKLK